MPMVAIICAWCGAESQKREADVRRANEAGRNVYCDRVCAGKARRKWKTDDDKKSEKREYDKRYRAKNADRIKAKKREWFQRTYDPAKAAIARKANMQRHAEYCRQPEYVKWKKQYDREYRAKKFYGEFWECHVLSMEIRDAVLDRSTAYQVRLDNDTFNKSQRRKRDAR